MPDRCPTCGLALERGEQLGLLDRRVRVQPRFRRGHRVRRARRSGWSRPRPINRGRRSRSSASSSPSFSHSCSFLSRERCGWPGTSASGPSEPGDVGGNSDVNAPRWPDCIAAKMIDAAPATSDNPLLAPSTLPFGAPPFDRIRDEHFLPAIELGMRQQLAEVAAIATQAADADVREHARGARAQRRSADPRAARFSRVAGTNTNDTLQDLQVEIAPRLAAHADAIHLDARLFARVRRDLRRTRAARALARTATARRALSSRFRARRRAARRDGEGDAARAESGRVRPLR